MCTVSTRIFYLVGVIRRARSVISNISPELYSMTLKHPRFAYLDIQNKNTQQGHLPAWCALWSREYRPAKPRASSWNFWPWYSHQRDVVNRGTTVSPRWCVPERTYNITQKRIISLGGTLVRRMVNVGLDFQWLRVWITNTWRLPFFGKRQEACRAFFGPKPTANR